MAENYNKIFKAIQEDIATFLKMRFAKKKSNIVTYKWNNVCAATILAFDKNLHEKFIFDQDFAFQFLEYHEGVHSVLLFRLDQLVGPYNLGVKFSSNFQHTFEIFAQDFHTDIVIRNF